MILKLSTLAILLISQNSFAMIGHDIFKTQEADHPNVCIIEIKMNNDQVGHCTGTLVSENTVYTAAHCFRRDFDLIANAVKVTCGGKDTSKAAKVVMPPKKQWINNTTPILDFDFAVVKLAFKTKLPPAMVATGPELYFDATGHTLPGVTCTMMGFGDTDITGSITKGTLIQSNLEHVRVVYTPSKLIQISPLEGETTLQTSVGEGDSGGPLFCQAPGHDSELLGVIDQVWWDQYSHIPVRNALNSVWAHQD